MLNYFRDKKRQIQGTFDNVKTTFELAFVDYYLLNREKITTFLNQFRGVSTYDTYKTEHDVQNAINIIIKDRRTISQTEYSTFLSNREKMSKLQAENTKLRSQHGQPGPRQPTR